MIAEISSSNTTSTTVYPSNKLSQVLAHWFILHSEATGDMVDRLEASLSEALELHPPVTVTVHINDDGSAYIAMDDENRSGTPFIFEMKDFPYSGGISEDLAPRACTLAFSCGTIAVVCSLHYFIADLRGLLDFVEVWAQLAPRDNLLSPTSEAGGKVALTIRNGLGAQNSEKTIADYISFFEYRKGIDLNTWMVDAISSSYCRFDL
ncbi:hypothetical protein BDB00DRAFT_939176 [Zychaea mexicana]|uniref:uncharacterized protein n=1 Tax=Zychaea mexicana TaxID=64656 RepID=UPI0022FF3FAE|nr:uncharacterized protein BDB00DRAFT_939176 [Zychaea mexicana]KAI9493122.1 hypothetical protein BDB00DRAFT_939176 [Zychaea mexicana]